MALIQPSCFDSTPLPPPCFDSTPLASIQPPCFDSTPCFVSPSSWPRRLLTVLDSTLGCARKIRLSPCVPNSQSYSHIYNRFNAASFNIIGFNPNSLPIQSISNNQFVSTPCFVSRFRSHTLISDPTFHFNISFGGSTFQLASTHQLALGFDPSPPHPPSLSSPLIQSTLALDSIPAPPLRLPPPSGADSTPFTPEHPTHSVQPRQSFPASDSPPPLIHPPLRSSAYDSYAPPPRPIQHFPPPPMSHSIQPLFPRTQFISCSTR